MKLLTVIISTLNEGILGLQDTVNIQHNSVEYLIVHQDLNNIELPKFLDRSDIKVIKSSSVGLAKSRNIALKHCKTKYALIADDDVIYFQNSFDTILKSFEKYQSALLLFKIRTYHSEPEYKNYPLEDYNLNREIKHWASSVEIAIDVQQINSNSINFDENFGLGTRLKKGEEQILINDLLKKNLRCDYINEYIVSHPFESSGKQKWSIKEQEFYYGAFDYRIGNSRLTLGRLKSYFKNITLIRDDLHYLKGYLYMLYCKIINGQ